MKKTLLAFSAAGMAISGLAAAPTQLQQTPANPQHESCLEANGFGNLRIASPASSAGRLPSKDAVSEDIISSVEGTKYDMTITGSGFYLMWGIFFDYYENQAVPAHVVYGENDNVYVYNMIPNFDLGYYVKGSKEGDKVVFDFPQTIYYDEDLMDYFAVTLFNPYTYMEDGEEAESYAPVDGPVSISFTVGEDGTWTTDDLSHEQLLGVGSCSYGYAWNGYGAMELSMAPFNDKPVAVPDDIEVSKNFWVYDAGGYGLPVNWAQGYDEFYFQGLSQYLPDAWIMGKVEYGDDCAVISIPQNQYLGTIDNSYIYTKCATIGETEDGWPIYVLEPEDRDFQLVWDYEEQTITPKDPDVYFLINKSKNELFYVEEFMDLTLIHQDSFAGTPHNPLNLDYYDGVLDGNWGYFNFNVPAVSTEGDYLLTDNLYYTVYIDGEEWEFDADEYFLDENLVEVPWSFDSLYITKWPGDGREISFFITGISTIGVQSIYRYNGEETRSDIVTIDLETSAVGTVDADRKATEVKYFDLSGREVAIPTSGIFVKRVTFDDGSTATYKKAIR